MGNSNSNTKNNTFIKKLLKLQNKHNLYNNDNPFQNKNKLLAIYDGIDTKLSEHFKLYEKYKEELFNLYEKFFVADLKSEKFIIKGLTADYQKIFMFFFNKRPFTELNMYESNIVFPQFNMQYFPTFNAEASLLRKIIINESSIIFNEIAESYNKLSNLVHLDLSYNNIPYISKELKRFVNLKYLYLRRNQLQSLSSELGDLKSLIEVDLSENEFSIVPEFLLHLPKLEILNLNMNKLTLLGCRLLNTKLKYLYLANNHFKSIPEDLSNFQNVKHCALDSNRIELINLIPLLSANFRTLISLSNNPIQNKDNFEEMFEGDILNLYKYEKEILNVKKTSKQKTMITDNEDLTHNEKEKKTKEKESKNEAIAELYFQNVQHPTERKIAERIRLKLESLKPLNVDDRLKDYYLENRREEIIVILKEIIERKGEAEIAKFADTDLKMELKYAYEKINKEKVKEFQESKYCSKTENRENDLKSKNTAKDVITTTGNDEDNVVFLKKADKSKNFTNQESKIILKQLKELDKQLDNKSNLHIYFKNLINEKEKYNLILILVELKIFIEMLINHYTEKAGGFNEIEYLFELSKDSNVIYSIFFDTNVVKILYKIGLNELRKEKNSCTTAVFKLTNGHHHLHKFLENFLQYLIGSLKKDSFDIVIIDS